MSEQDIGKLGVRQWIRDRFIEKIQEFDDREDKDPNVMTREVEIYLHREFKKEVDETLKELMERVEGVRDE